MNRLKNTGLVLCGLVLGLSLSAPAAQAVESLKATLSTNRILVDGQETHMTAYTIGGSNYVRLRDIGKAVGFEVYWDKIQPENLRWYAAFHQKPNQVHIHMIIFSEYPKEGYLTKEGIREMKSVFARRIYHADRMHIYQQKDTARQELQVQTRRAMVECIAQMEHGTSDNLRLEQLTEELAERLMTIKGRKVYG